MKSTRLFTILAFGFLLHLPLQAGEAWPMPPASYFIKRIPPPPGEGSAMDRSDLDYVLAIQACATPKQINHTRVTDSLNPFTIFDGVLGPKFTKANYPLTNALLEKLSVTGEKIKDELKSHYARKRPVDAHQENGVVSYVARHSGFSYPSGHSLRGWLYALLLSDLVPQKKNQLIACGGRVGDDRVVAGVHYQTDIMASRALGRLIFDKLKSDPQFVAELESARKAEWPESERK